LNHGYTYTDIVNGDAEGESILGFYTTRYTHSSEEVWRERLESGAVLLDGERIDQETKLKRGQTLTYHREAWQEPEAPRDFEVLYEDNQIIAVNKPGGLPVLPSGHHLENTLLSVVRERFGGDVPPSPLHRLGRGTSGIVLFARDSKTLQELSNAFRNRSITKVYRALVCGVGLEPEILIEQPIGKIDYPPTGQLYAATPDGKPSVSECTMLWEKTEDDHTLLDVKIITGRPHQIRIHVAAIGHPLVGDPLYVSGGGPAPLVQGERAPLPGDIGYHLHARLLEFTHPATGEQVKVEATPPKLLQTEDELENLN
jgi:23S rRNA pseudouridine1911/1915/1917 synthase